MNELENNYRRFWTLFVGGTGNGAPSYFSKDDAIERAKKLALDTPGNPVYIMEASQGYVVPPRTPVCFVPKDE